MSRQRIASRVDLLTVPLDPDETAGWKAYHQYQGSTHNADYLSCHASVLIPGHCPHPPHSHPEEEILLMLQGEAELILPTLRSGEGKQQPLRLKPGQFVYYPAHFHHTLRTVSTEPANYVMFKWRARPRRSGAQLQFGQFDAGDSCFSGRSATAFDYRLLFEGPTSCLELLHSHASRLASGAENAPHSHSYETAMVVLEGEIETLGQRVRRHGLVFYSSGTPHGIRNPTSEPARYLVFEFHGRLPFWRKFIDPHWWGHRLHAVWNGG
jgi:quercetin dioxygenase-like cupin family protein